MQVPGDTLAGDRLGLTRIHGFAGEYSLCDQAGLKNRHGRVRKSVSVIRRKLLGFDQSIGQFAFRCDVRVWGGDDTPVALVEAEYEAQARRNRSRDTQQFGTALNVLAHVDQILAGYLAADPIGPIGWMGKAHCD